MSSTLLVLQHTACEPPAAFEDELRSRGLELIRVELDEGERLPDWRDFAATIVELTDAAGQDPVFADAPSSFPTLQWHGDSFDLPKGATLLASSPAYPNLAFRYKRVYALESLSR